MLEAYLLIHGVFSNHKIENKTEPQITIIQNTDIVMQTTMTTSTTTSNVTTSVSEVTKETKTTHIETEPTYTTTTTTSTTEKEVVAECDDTNTALYAEQDKANFAAKYYCGGSGTYGYYGRDLVSGYSVATWEYPGGTLLYVETDGSFQSGVYRVDDTGCPYGVIDFYYEHGQVPHDFAYNGVVDIKVTVLK